MLLQCIYCYNIFSILYHFYNPPASDKSCYSLGLRSTKLIKLIYNIEQFNFYYSSISVDSRLYRNSQRNIISIAFLALFKPIISHYQKRNESALAQRCHFFFHGHACTIVELYLPVLLFSISISRPRGKKVGAH